MSIRDRLHFCHVFSQVDEDLYLSSRVWIFAWYVIEGFDLRVHDFSVMDLSISTASVFVLMYSLHIIEHGIA